MHFLMRDQQLPHSKGGGSSYQAKKLPGTQLSAWCFLRWWKITRALMRTLGNGKHPMTDLLHLWKSCWIRKIASMEDEFPEIGSSSSRVPTAISLPDIIKMTFPKNQNSATFSRGKTWRSPVCTTIWESRCWRNFSQSPGNLKWVSHMIHLYGNLKSVKPGDFS